MVIEQRKWLLRTLAPVGVPEHDLREGLYYRSPSRSVPSPQHVLRSKSDPGGQVNNAAHGERVTSRAGKSTWLPRSGVRKSPSSIHTSSRSHPHRSAIRRALGVSSVCLCHARGGCRRQTVLLSVIGRFSREMQPHSRRWSEAQRVSRPAFTGTLYQPEKLLQANE
jgi:hypothetical protein